MELPQMSKRHRSLLKLFSLQTSSLPIFRATENEQWRTFESTFRVKWATSALGHFPLHMQKRVLLSRLEESATRAHMLLDENTEGWKTSTSIESFLVQFRNIFNPPAESDLARIVFEQICQKKDEPITVYYSRKADALYAMQEPGPELFIYFKNHAIRGIYAPHISQKVI